MLDILLRHVFPRRLPGRARLASDKPEIAPARCWRSVATAAECSIHIATLTSCSSTTSGVDRIPSQVNEMIKQVLYALWDIGFKVGHATRSIREACDHANRDNISKTALLESRFLAGRERLVAEFRQRFEQTCIRGQESRYLAWRQEDQRTRHLKYGPTVFLQEPNVKSSPGGLRDYHNLLWSLLFLRHDGRRQPPRGERLHPFERTPHPRGRQQFSAARPYRSALPHPAGLRCAHVEFPGTGSPSVSTTRSTQRPAPQ